MYSDFSIKLSIREIRIRLFEGLEVPFIFEPCGSQCIWQKRPFHQQQHRFCCYTVAFSFPHTFLFSISRWQITTFISSSDIQHLDQLIKSETVTFAWSQTFQEGIYNLIILWRLFGNTAHVTLAMSGLLCNCNCLLCLHCQSIGHTHKWLRRIFKGNYTNFTHVPSAFHHLLKFQTEARYTQIGVRDHYQFPFWY